MNEECVKRSDFIFFKQSVDAQLRGLREELGHLRAEFSEFIEKGEKNEE